MTKWKRRAVVTQPAGRYAMRATGMAPRYVVVLTCVLISRLRLLDIEQEVHHIAILHAVFLALDAQQAGGPAGRLAAQA